MFTGVHDKLVDKLMFTTLHVTLSHLRSKESIGIHKPCILALLPARGTCKCTPVYISNVPWESNSFEPSDLSFDPQAKVKLALFI